MKWGEQVKVEKLYLMAASDAVLESWLTKIHNLIL
jgi:hypothetical protein